MREKKQFLLAKPEQDFKGQTKSIAAVRGFALGEFQRPASHNGCDCFPSKVTDNLNVGLVVEAPLISQSF